MTMATYADRQKVLIRERHIGDEMLIIGGKQVAVRQREEILRDLDQMAGLNKSERETFPSRRIQRA